MRRLMDIGFILVIALGCLGLDFYIQKRDSAADQFTIADYVALRREDVNDLLNPPSLSGALPSEIDGWSIARQGADQMMPGSAESRTDQASEIALVKAIEKLTKSGTSAGQMVGMTMTKGDTRLRVMAVLLEQSSAIEGLDVASAAGGLGQMLEHADALAGTAAFDIVDGVAFTELPVAGLSGDADMRMMRAVLGGAMSVNVITQSDDDKAIKEALQAIDFVMLNKLLNSPVDGVIDGSKIDLRGTGPATPSVAPDLAVPNGVAADLADIQAPDIAAPNVAAAKSPKVAPAETAVFLAPPDQGGAQASAPCVRRAGVLVCPDG